MGLVKTVFSGIINAWKKLGLFLNKITSPIILGIVYFVILTPFALIYQLSRKRGKSKKDSTFINRSIKYGAKDFENLW